MLLPKTKDVGKVIDKLKKDNPEMSKKQKVAIALDTARKAGADIPDKRKRFVKQLAKRSLSAY